MTALLTVARATRNTASWLINILSGADFMIVLTRALGKASLLVTVFADELSFGFGLLGAEQPASAMITLTSERTRRR